MGHNLPNLHVLDLEFVKLLFYFSLCFEVSVVHEKYKTPMNHSQRHSDLTNQRVLVFTKEAKDNEKHTHSHPCSALKQNK